MVRGGRKCVAAEGCVYKKKLNLKLYFKLAQRTKRRKDFEVSDFQKWDGSVRYKHRVVQPEVGISFFFK